MAQLAASGAESSLAARLREGDRAAFDAFYEAHFRRIYPYAMRRTEDRVTAEWVTRETLTEVLGRLDELSGSEVPAAWVLRVLLDKLALVADAPVVAPLALPPRGRFGSPWRRLARLLRRQAAELVR